MAAEFGLTLLDVMYLPSCFDCCVYRSAASVSRRLKTRTVGSRRDGTSRSPGYHPHLPTEPESRLAQESGRRLAAYYRAGESIRVRVVEDYAESSEIVHLPASAVRLLLDILAQMGEGNAVDLVPIHAELTTQQAADLLNVSRPHLVKLLERGDIPHRKVGTHRRVLAANVFAYRDRHRKAREQTLAELAALDQELGLE